MNNTSVEQKLVKKIESFEFQIDIDTCNYSIVDIHEFLSNEV